MYMHAFYYLFATSFCLMTDVNGNNNDDDDDNDNDDDGTSTARMGSSAGKERR